MPHDLMNHDNNVDIMQKSQMQIDMLSCKICGFHGGVYEEWRLLGCYAVWLLQEPTFRSNLTPSSSG
jgi:hypothetical protein